MRRDDQLLDPEVLASLEAIDATLAGKAVDPRHAELAELALLLAAERPAMDESFATSLDDRLERRFARATAAGPRRRRWLLPTAGLASASLAALIVIVVLVGGGSSSAPQHGLETLNATSSSSAGATAAPAPAAASRAKAPSSANASAAGSGPRSSAATAFGSPGSLQLPANGRKIVQSAQLSLSAASGRIDDVAQELFNVVGTENGVVNHSTVTQTGGTDGYAEFQLSVPSSSLGQTMSLLSRLRYAHVLSRTDASQDVGNQFATANRRLADARALRTALLKQLADATTTEQVDSLRAQIRDADAAIGSDEAALARLNRKVNFSQLSVTITAATPPVPVAHGGGFTIHKAAHDAVRVLNVAAGVALISLAALFPVALLAILAWWIGSRVRRRRRDAALDLA